MITPDVTEAMEKYGFPGMKVLLFAFSGDFETHPYNPDNFIEDCVAYTGTHDNNTIKGWYQHDATEEEKEHLETCLDMKIKVAHLHWDLIEVLLASKAAVILIPIQDVLGLGAEARMNRPGTPHGNWHWRLLADQIKPHIVKKLLSLTKETQR